MEAAKSKEHFYQPQFKPYKETTLKMYRFDDHDGKGRYRLQEVRTYGKETLARKLQVGDAVERDGKVYLKQYLSQKEGNVIDTVWEDIESASYLPEKLGYPTQKPESLLERIIKASSHEGDVVLDPFCGCGTTINVAERLHRRWIGIDITHLAIALIKHRLADTFHTDLSPYEVIGDPKDLASAEALALQDRYQFEWWALGLVDAQPAQNKKKGADSGIDGYIYFFDDDSGKAKKIIVQVKSGHPTVPHIRDLKGVLQREDAALGVYITLEEPTRPMRTEATSAGFYEPEHFNGSYPRVQLLTITELLEGKTVQYPRQGLPATFKKAERKEKEGRSTQLFFL